MWICSKCRVQVAEAGKICRACGGILEEATDAAGSAEEPESPESEAEPQPLSFRRDWLCPQCGETVPGNFELCWKCMKNRPNDSPLASLGAMPSAIVSTSESLTADTDEESEPPEIDPPVRILSSRGIDDAEPRESAAEVATTRPVSPRRQCVGCGSTRMIHAAKLLMHHDTLRSQVVVMGNPDAIFFQDPMYGDVVTDICGECGHIHLRAANPAVLYDHVQRAAREQNR